MDPNQPQTVAPAPASPEQAPAVSGAPVGLSQEEMRANLKGMMEKIQGKYQDFNAQKFSSESKSKEQQSQALREIFSILESMGVDPSSPEEVNAFLEELKIKNPELAQQIETALKSVLGEDQEVVEEPVGEEVPPEGNMNTNEVPSQDV